MYPLVPQSPDLWSQVCNTRAIIDAILESWFFGALNHLTTGRPTVYSSRRKSHNLLMQNQMDYD